MKQLFPTIALGLFVLISFGSSVSFAQQSYSATPSGGITPPTLDQLIQGIPGSITGFFGNAKQFTPVTINPSQLQVTPANAQGIFRQIDQWFLTNTGISLTKILQLIFQFLVWLTTLAIELVKWGLSLLGIH